MSTGNLIKHSYNGAIVSQDSDSYVSLTDMAKASGKKVNDYLRLGTTEDYFSEFSTDTGIPVSALVKTFKGGSGKQGTWAHPEIAIDFAQWCSSKFKVWANRTLRGVIAQPKSEPKKAIAHYSDRVADIRWPARIVTVESRCASGGVRTRSVPGSPARHHERQAVEYA